MKLFALEDDGFILKWNKVFLFCSVIALSLDPLFLYVPVVNANHKCLDIDRNLAIVVCVLRSFADILYVFHIIIQFRTPHLHVRGGFNDPKRYLTSYFMVDVLIALPLPQLAVFVIIPNLDSSASFSKESLLKFIIFFQYVPRVIQTSLFHQKVTKFSDYLFEKAWAGAAFNLFLYVLVSYVVGALWYVFAIESELRCWHIACERHNCNSNYLYCGKGHVGKYLFLNTSCPLLERSEIKDLTNFDFGIFLEALQTHVLETRDIRQKVLYCSLWGLQALSSLGQGLSSSTFDGEILFTYFIVVTGLVLYASLFGNIQKYLQSSSNQSLRTEEMKEKKNKAEDLMSYMLFPEELRNRVRRHNQYKWNRTRGVELHSFLRDLPRDLRQDIKRHLFFPLLKTVPLFKHMDEHVLDAICDCLKLAHYTENSYLVKEGHPAHEMLFIKRGKLLSTITDSGRSSFFSPSHLKADDFCGEEIIAWVINQERQQLLFPTMTVKALTDVEAFTLAADDFLSIASQFSLFHSTRLTRSFRFYSEQWRTWAACCVQSAWRRRCKRRHVEEADKRLQDASLGNDSETSTLSIVAYVYVSRFSSNILRILRRKRQIGIYKTHISTSKLELMPQKSTQPNFDDDDDDDAVRQIVKNRLFQLVKTMSFP